MVFSGKITISPKSQNSLLKYKVRILYVCAYFYSFHTSCDVGQMTTLPLCAECLLFIASSFKLVVWHTFLFLKTVDNPGESWCGLCIAVFLLFFFDNTRMSN